MSRARTIRELIAILLLCAGVTPSTGQAAGGGSWQRPVEPAGTGSQQLLVDAALIAASADGTLRDLRLIDSAGKEVPYLLVPPPVAEGSWRGGRISPIAATKELSGFEVDLGRPVATGRLRLEKLPPPFLKRYRLEGSGDRRHWTLLVPEGTFFHLPDEGLRQLEAKFPESEYRFLRVTWYDQESHRLPLPGAASVYLPPAGASPTTTVELTFVRRPSEPRVSRYRLRLPGRLPIGALILDVGGGHLLRHAKVLEAHLNDGTLVPVALGEAELRRTVRGQSVAESLRIPVTRPEEQELELQVEDGDNPPLELRGVRGELEPLPWIYFESPDGAGITARCGDGRLQSPRYDLEAMRDRLASVRLAVARWGSPSVAASPAPPADFQADPGPGGTIDPAGFGHRRPVLAAEPALSALRLDGEVLATSDLNDLRLVNSSGQQIPYLLERRDEPLAMELSPPSATTRGHVSTHLIKLPVKELPDSRLVLETSARVFERRVQVFEESLRVQGGGAPSEHLLAEATWRHADPETTAPALTLPLPRLRGRQILVRVDEGDNRPLVISSARLLLPSWWIRFFHPGTPLTLLYGRRDLPPPRYDLALLAPRLRAVPAKEVALAAEPQAAEAAPPVSFDMIFWVVLAVAVVALLLLLARLLGRGVEPKG